MYAGKVCETGHIKKAKSVEHKKRGEGFTTPPSLWLLGICSGDRRGEGFPTLAGFVVKGDTLHGAAFTCLLSCSPPAVPPHCPVPGPSSRGARLGALCTAEDACMAFASVSVPRCAPPRFPAQNTRKTTPSRDRPLFPALPPVDAAPWACPAKAARPGLPPGARLRR